MFCSPAHSLPQQSSSSGGLLPEMMESETAPQASSPNRADDFEVSSRRISPDQQRIMETTPQGETSAAQGPKCAVPTGANIKGSGLSGLQPETTLGSSRHTLSKGVRTVTVASGNPVAPDTRTNMLRYSSISEEHRTLMGTVVERILPVKSRLNEAFMGLLRGFEVCNVIFSIVLCTQNAPMYR